MKSMCPLTIIFLLLSNASFASDNDNLKYAWEGYWHAPSYACWNRGSNDQPLGFFSNRVENWEAECEVDNIDKASDSSEYDTLNLNCKSDKNGSYKQPMRLKLDDEGRLRLLWPGGFGIILTRCEDKI